MYYVYEYRDPSTGIPFYVGTGKGNRAYYHLNMVKRGKSDSNKHKCNYIRSILDCGSEPIITITHKNLSLVESREIECELISLYGRRDKGTGSLTNMTDGGDGGITFTRPVDQYNVYGEFIQTHESACSAARALFNATNGNTITECCRGRRITSYGFVWCYHGTLPVFSSRIKPVYAWDMKGNFIARYPSIGKACSTHPRMSGLGNEITKICNREYTRSHIHRVQWTWYNESPGESSCGKSHGTRQMCVCSNGMCFNSRTEAYRWMSANEVTHLKKATVLEYIRKGIPISGLTFTHTSADAA